MPNAAELPRRLCFIDLRVPIEHVIVEETAIPLLGLGFCAVNSARISLRLGLKSSQWEGLHKT